MLGQIKPSFINSTPVADLAAFDRIAWQQVFCWGTRTQCFGSPPFFVPAAGINI